MTHKTRITVLAALAVAIVASLFAVADAGIFFNRTRTTYHVHGRFGAVRNVTIRDRGIIPAIRRARIARRAQSVTAYRSTAAPVATTYYAASTGSYGSAGAVQHQETVIYESTPVTTYYEASGGSQGSTGVTYYYPQTVRSAYRGCTNCGQAVPLGG